MPRLAGSTLLVVKACHGGTEREVPVVRTGVVRCATVIAWLGVGVFGNGMPGLRAQGASALSGTVRSATEGRMEGVLVTARRDGAAFDVTVVSDAKGRYSFPRTHLADAGKYAIRIRAAGFDLASPGAVELTAGKTATLDLRLEPAKDVASQLSSAEWLLNVPGTDEQKSMVQRQIQSCTYCHSMERIVKSKHTAAQFVAVITRMQKYYPDGSMAGTETPARGRARFTLKERQDMAEKADSWGVSPGVKKTDLAAYLATINLSGGRTLPATFRTLPRPTGKATRVIVTQYDMPRRDTVPHDSDMDHLGNVWYTDQSDYFVGRFDPKTATFKEWPLPKASTHAFGGGSDVAVDKLGRPWFNVTSDKVSGHFGVTGVFDPKTEKYEFMDFGLTYYPQFNALAPDGSLISGYLKIDVNQKTLLDNFDYYNSPNKPAGPHISYEPAMNSKGHWFITDFAGSYIVEVDAKTRAITWHKTPTLFSEPRRGRIDAQDRFWFAEYTADNLAMLDTRTSKMTEWPTGIKWSGPYTATVPDLKGRVYSPAGSADRVFRLDPTSGEMLGYLMPTKDFDVKQASVDPVGRKAIWMANVRNARLVKLEPLD